MFFCLGRSSVCLRDAIQVNIFFAGILIESSTDIVVQGASATYQSTEGFLALPSAALGTNYYAVTYIYQHASAYNQVRTLSCYIIYIQGPWAKSTLAVLILIISYPTASLKHPL